MKGDNITAQVNGATKPINSGTACSSSTPAETDMIIITYKIKSSYSRQFMPLQLPL